MNHENILHEMKYKSDKQKIAELKLKTKSYWIALFKARELEKRKALDKRDKLLKQIAEEC